MGLEGVKESYKGLHGLQRQRELKAVPKGHWELEGVTGKYRRLQGVTGGYKTLPGVTGVTLGYRWF